MEEFTVVGAILGHSTVFSFEIKRNVRVSALKRKIRAEEFQTLSSFQASVLKLYFVNIPLPEPSACDTLMDTISECTIEFNEDAPLHSLCKLSNIPGGFPEDNLHILVVVPPDEQDDDSNTPSINFQSLVTFKLRSPLKWEPFDLVNNKIARLLVAETKPDYITRLEGRLSQKRLVKPNHPLFNLTNHWPIMSIDNYFEAHVGSDASDTLGLREVTHNEAYHYNAIFDQPTLRDQIDFRNNKEPLVHTLLFGLSPHVRGVQSGTASLKFDFLWDFLLIVKSLGSQSRYTPKSDASLRINNFPHLILEVISEPDESDCIRMLLQASCLARLGNGLRQGEEQTHPLIISAIYVDNELRARWHLMYQPVTSDITVKYVEETYDLTDAKRTFDFIFRLYNFVSLAIEDNDTLRDPFENIHTLKQEVNDMGLMSFTSRKRKTNVEGAGNKRSKKPSNEGGPVQNDILSDVAILEALKRAGYTIPDEVEGFESLLPLTTKMHEAVSANGERVILKLTDQHEVEVLRRLHDNQSNKPTRIVPLLEVIDERLIVLPLRTPLLHFLTLDASVGDVTLLALQFLEGVVHMQRSSVAHLDLKPQNIVVQEDPRSKKVALEIIDFEIAALADVEPTISDSSGTSGWSAPEASTGGPYNTLLADRWSCGRVLMFFAEHMAPSQMRKVMRLWSQRLMDPNPSQRPLVPNLYKLQKMAGMLNVSNRLPKSGPNGAPGRRSGKPRSSRQKT